MKRIVKQGVKACLRRVGHWVRPYDYLQKYTFAYQLFSLFQRYAVDCVFDVGANVGLYRNFLRMEVGYRGLILSFEPVAKNVDTLKRLSLNDPQWRIYGLALGNEQGQKMINVMRSHLFTSFLEPDAQTIAEFDQWNQVCGHESVLISRLAEVFPPLTEEFSFRRPVLKIDTQGYDLEVLKGAGDTLEQFVAVQTEASVIPLYRTMPHFLEIHRFLTARNFALSAFQPVVSDSRSRLIEFDWVFVNQQFS
jgi:FkbM family methyltransferase